MDIPSVELAGFSFVGSGLRRPEGVCVDGDGAVWVSDAGGLVARIDPDREGGEATRVGQGGVAPNGLAAGPGGTVVVADYGAGRVVRVDGRRGVVDVVAVEAEGRPVTTPNFPAFDQDGRLWCSNSTSTANPTEALRRQIDDGFLFVIEADGAITVAADGLRFANGIALSGDGAWLYVAESAARVVTRFPVDGAHLGRPEQYGPVLPSIPDGVAVDEGGNVWVTLVHVVRGLAVIDPSGDAHMVVEGPAGSPIGNPSNVAFGGLDRQTIYLGTLDLDRVPWARVDVPGLRLPNT